MIYLIALIVSMIRKHKPIITGSMTKHRLEIVSSALSKVGGEGKVIQLVIV